VRVSSDHGGVMLVSRPNRLDATDDSVRRPIFGTNTAVDCSPFPAEAEVLQYVVD
jgi:hypothetical protein